MLTEYQMNTLRAAVNRIIPADDYPAGWEGGVGDYLSRQFTTDLQPLLPTYAAGLDSLDAESQIVYNLSFALLTDADQDALLAKVEVGEVRSVWLVDPIVFFRMLVNHCAEGYYSDPGNGGNGDEIAWKMIGFEVNDDTL
jgi:hypothetical protein